MTTNHYRELVCTKEEYELLKNVLADVGVVLNFSMTDCKEYHCYVRNPSKEVISLWGNEREKELEKEFFDRYER